MLAHWQILLLESAYFLSVWVSSICWQHGCGHSRCEQRVRNLLAWALGSRGMSCLSTLTLRLSLVIWTESWTSDFSLGWTGLDDATCLTFPREAGTSGLRDISWARTGFSSRPSAGGCGGRWRRLLQSGRENTVLPRVGAAIMVGPFGCILWNLAQALY
jgi:hypothetical protein